MPTMKPIRLTPDRSKASKKAVPIIPPSSVSNANINTPISDEPLELVYNIRYSVFRLAPASQLLACPPTNKHPQTPEKPAKDSETLLSGTIDSSPLLDSNSGGYQMTRNLGGITASSQPQTIIKEVIKSPPRTRFSSSRNSSLLKLASKSGKRSQSILGLRRLSKNRSESHDFKDEKPHLEIPGNLPPVLVDGKMLIVELPRWKRKIDFCWRTSDGSRSKVLIREVALPLWVWLGTNGPRRRWTELWVERG